MTPTMTAFRALAIALFGPKWQNPTSRALGVSPRTVRYWVSADRAPGYAVTALRHYARSKVGELLRLVNG